MAWTKRDLIKHSFDALGLASYVFDLQSEQLQSAMFTLDAMMLEWNSPPGLRLAYNAPSSPTGGDLDDASGIPDRAIAAVYLNLACRLASHHGKTLPQDIRVAAQTAYRALLSQSTSPGEMQLNETVPAGAGNKHWGWDGSPFLNAPTDNLEVGNDDELEF